MTDRYYARPASLYTDEHAFCVYDTNPFPWDIVCWCDDEPTAELIAAALNSYVPSSVKKNPASGPAVAVRMVSGPYPGDIWDFVFEFEDEP